MILPVMIVTAIFLDFSLFLSIFVQIVSIITAVKFTVLTLHCFFLKDFFFFLAFFLYCITIFYSVFPRYLNLYKSIVNICILEKCVWLSSVNMLNVRVYTEIVLIAQNDLGLILPLKINQANRVS